MLVEEAVKGKGIRRFRRLRRVCLLPMGEVYLAHDSQLRRPVALKLLPTQFAKDETRLRRFRQEAFGVPAPHQYSIFTNLPSVPAEFLVARRRLLELPALPSSDLR